MTSSPIVPCLWIDEQAEQAAEFYVAAFGDGRVDLISRYPSSGPNPSGKRPGSVLTAEFTVAGQRFTAMNGGPNFRPNPSISFFAYVETADEADRLFHALNDGGVTMMELGAYPWSPRYGWAADRYGVSWQVMFAPGMARTTIAPSLMFTGAQHGRAREAIDLYVAAFPGSRVDHVEAFAEGEGPAGTVKLGSFSLAGQSMAAMDSGFDHGFAFDEGVSLQVTCPDQATVDHYWTTLSDGGEEGPCGWLKDRFGVSWQVVPDAMAAWMTHPDPAARDRAFRAMLEMTKLDVAALERALAGE